MPDLSSPQPFRTAAIAAFPSARQEEAIRAARLLQPLIDHTYRTGAEDFWFQGERVRIPSRLHFRPGWLVKASLRHLPVEARCLITRSTDGHLRQAALGTLLDEDAPWAIPFVANLASDYVIEIVEDIRAALSSLNNAAYVETLRSDPKAARLIRARATSYWACYYRAAYPELRTYPGIEVLNQWAN
jgi:hypothetical protein